MKSEQDFWGPIRIDLKTSHDQAGELVVNNWGRVRNNLSEQTLSEWKPRPVILPEPQLENISA